MDWPDRRSSRCSSLQRFRAGLSQLAYLALFGLGTIAGMALITAGIAVPPTLGAVHECSAALRIASGVASIAFGLILAHESASSTDCLPRRRPGRRNEKTPSAARGRISDADAQAFSSSLRRWFQANSRDLPWRKTRDRLRSARVGADAPADAGLARRPTTTTIPDGFPTLAPRRPRQARASDGGVDGLGYYARARISISSRVQVTDRGRDAERRRCPPTPKSCESFPASARTPRARSLFAYERRAALVDTNVARVLERVFAPGTKTEDHRGRRRSGRSPSESCQHGQGGMDAQPGVDGARRARLHGSRTSVYGLSRNRMCRSRCQRSMNNEDAGPSLRSAMSVLSARRRLSLNRKKSTSSSPPTAPSRPRARRPTHLRL